MKNKYDTSVIFLYAIGKENVMPCEFRKQIPSSTISTWRKTNYSECFRLILFVRQKVSKKLLIPEGDFCARGRRKTAVKAEANAQSQPFLSFAAITTRNQLSEKHFSKLQSLTLN
jgi:hypothetical protein